MGGLGTKFRKIKSHANLFWVIVKPFTKFWVIVVCNAHTENVLGHIVLQLVSWPECVL